MVKNASDTKAGAQRSASTPARKDAAPATPGAAEPFWRKPLEALTRPEWEALCDGCGRCCLVKLEDEDTGRIHFTNLVCRLFDPQSCRCVDYPNRAKRVPDCITLTLKEARELPWLPPTCAYRLRAQGKDLAWWHPLVSGSPDTVHEAGISVRGRAGPNEDDVPVEDYPDYVVRWPGNAPKGRKPRA